MPEYIRALIVILALATVVFYFVRKPATDVAIAPDDFVRRRNAWFCITLAGFLSQNYWVFVAIVSIVIYTAAKKEQNKIALFFFLVLALPQIRVEIPGLAGIRYFFAIDYVRILAAIILIPICVKARKLAVKNRIKARFPDRFLATYIVLSLVLQAQYDTGTNVVRSGIAWGIDVVVPYYAISRSVKDIQSFKDIFMSFVVAAMLVSIVGIFEFTRHWILYSSVGNALGVEWNPGYLARGDLLRASATSGQSIVLGYVIAVAMGLFLVVRKDISNSRHYLLCMCVLLMGIVSPLSRGPWLGLGVMLLVFIATGPNSWKRLFKAGAFVLMITAALMATKYGETIIDYLPFAGSIDSSNVTYRKNLFDISLQIILDNPFFGSTDYLLRMEELRNGQEGIIDLVNTFLIVALNTGLVGLGLYLLFFLNIAIAVTKRLVVLPINGELHLLSRSLLAVLIGILFITATVSPIYHVPLLFWSIAALMVASLEIKTVAKLNI